MNSFMLRKQPMDRYVKMIEGVSRNTLVHGDKTVLCKFMLDGGAVLPLHSHPYEQTGYMLSGKMLFTIDGEKHEVAAGDSWCIKADVEHGAEVLEDTLVIEVFSPVREDYL